jgi:MerR family transcriptional regulator, light-induced transcriptional regulator
MSGEPEDTQYTIAAVSKLTGISCHALRIWERRYGFPMPCRSASGHRRYGRDQVRILRRISELSHQGHSVSDLIPEVLAGRLPGEKEPHPGELPGGEVSVAGLIDRLTAGDVSGGEVCYEQLTRDLDTTELVDRVFDPALVDVGDRWFRHECDIHQERYVSGFLRRKLAALIEAAHQANKQPTPTIVIGTVQGDRHEGGVLMLHLLLERAGWRVVNLGVDLPVPEYRKAVEAWHPEALGLSFVLSRNIKKRFRELAQIRGLPIFVGGRSILNYQGLAHRHGLIPLPGPITLTINQLQAVYEDWCKASAKPRSAFDVSE